MIRLCGKGRYNDGNTFGSGLFRKEFLEDRDVVDVDIVGVGNIRNVVTLSEAEASSWQHWRAVRLGEGSRRVGGLVELRLVKDLPAVNAWNLPVDFPISA